MRTGCLTRLDLRHSRKVDGHNFLSLSTPVKTERKKGGKYYEKVPLRSYIKILLCLTFDGALIFDPNKPR